MIIFDEIQECPKALNSLKYFCEEANHYHIVAAGSLLGVKTAYNLGFPVGKVNFLSLYPLSFFEFLTATGNTRLRSYLNDLNTHHPLPEALHEKLITLLKYYCFVGGMPEAVVQYIQHDKVSMAREVQLEILDSYERDFAKHAPNNQIMKINAVWQQVHRQLAKENKKFVFANIRRSARGRDYEEAIQWLVDAGLLYKSYQVSAPTLPLSSAAQTSFFKVFFHDVGLLGAQGHLSAKAIITGDTLFREFKGALAENYVAQQLVSCQNSGLYYWTSQGQAEVDFLLETQKGIYPLEVKAGISNKKKSPLSAGRKLAVASVQQQQECVYRYPQH